MGTPRRTTILSNIGTTLETITTGNGYKTTVATVEAVAKSFGDMGSGAKPFIGYAPVRERLAYQPFNDIECTLSVTLLCHIAGNTQSDRATKLNNLLDDVITALAVDTTRGSVAISTTVTEAQTDEGSPDAGGFGSMLLNVDVRYLRTSSAS